MKRLMAVLIVAVVMLCLVACEDGENSHTTVHNGSDASNNSQTSTDSNISTTTHTHQEHTTTTGVDGSSQEGNIGGETGSTTGSNGDESTQGGSDTPTTSATTVHGGRTTTNQSITTTTKRGETTTSNKTTSSNKTTTTTKKTTTTTKKTTTTTRNPSTAHSHKFATASYTKIDYNNHKVTGKCSGCGATVTQTELHSWGSWKYDSQPTSTKEGVKYRVCTGCGEEQVTTVPPTSANTANFPKEMMDLVNAERAKYGLPAFKYYTAAQSGANTRAQEIMQYFSHNRPDGSKWWTIASFDKSVCQSGAENIARGYGDPADVVAAFMASSSHRTYILSTKYTHIVIGYYEGAWVQIFTKPW